MPRSVGEQDDQQQRDDDRRGADDDRVGAAREHSSVRGGPLGQLIDGGLVNGSARLVGWASQVSRQLQSGYLYHYAFAMIIGLAVLVGWLLLGA